MVTKAAFTPVIGVFAVFLPFISVAQHLRDSLHSTNHLNEVVVTGQYGENSLKNSVYRVKLIDQKRIQQQGAVTLNDIMANELNVRISNDAALGSGMNIQGMNGQNVKIMIDGVPVIGREGGSINLSQINLANIERIELVEGPMSVNYGTDALGGVVNLISKKGLPGKTEASLNSYAESSGKFNAGFNTSVAVKNYTVQFNGGRNFFDGFNAKDSGRFMTWKPFTQYFGDISIGRVYTKGSIRWQNGFFDEKVSDRDSGTITPYYAFGIDHYYYTRRLTSSAFYHYKLNEKFTIDVLASYNYYRRISNTWSKDLVSLQEVLVPSQDQQDTTYFYSWMSRGTISAPSFNKRLSWQGGYEVNHEENSGHKISGNSQTISDYNLFGSAEMLASKHLMVKPGLRIIYNSRFNAPLAPSVNFKWDIRDFMTIRASYGRGFRAPSLKEMYLLFVDPNHNVYGNTDLKAELSDNFQLSTGCEWKASEHVFRIEPSFFYNHLKNKIALVQYQPGGTNSSVYYKYSNIDQYKGAGTNLTAEYRTPRYSFVFGYAYTGVNNILSGYSQSDKFYFSNEVKFNFSYSFPKQFINVSLFYKYNGKQQLPQIDGKTQSLITGYINPYSLTDITLTKQLFSKRISLSTGCKNLLNVRNVSANMASGVHSDISSSAMIGMGRLYFISLTLQVFNR